MVGRIDRGQVPFVLIRYFVALVLLRLRDQGRGGEQNYRAGQVAQDSDHFNLHSCSLGWLCFRKESIRTVASQ